MSITSSTFGKRTYKIVLLGDTSTGKTSIIDRFVNNKFEEKDNVLRLLGSPPLALTFSAKMWRTTVQLVASSSGTLPVKNAIDRSSPAI
jgi:GTPase SAR1 family protein